jgi:hypothetical protein
MTGGGATTGGGSKGGDNTGVGREGGGGDAVVVETVDSQMTVMPVTEDSCDVVRAETTEATEVVCFGEVVVICVDTLTLAPTAVTPT